MSAALRIITPHGRLLSGRRELARIIKTSREGLGITRTELARRTGVCYATVKRMELGLSVTSDGGWLGSVIKILEAIELRLEIR